jgi:CubicO group peptidase (beta-lactamase class C family)
MTGSTTARSSGADPGIDSVLAAYDRPGVPGASVLVLGRGHVVHLRSYGLADVEARIPATPATTYRLASLTKQFTAAAIMLLVKDGRLAYDDRVATILPDLPAHAHDVTVRHLLNHTSGLWDYEDFVPDTQSRQVKDRDVLALLGRADRTYFAPGAQYRYSNTGYAVLALIVERVSGQPFAGFLRDRVFTPLGMRSAVAYEAGVSEVPNRAWGYTERAGGFVRTDQSPTSAVLGDGGVYASVVDLATWDRALTAGALLSTDEMQPALSPPVLPAGATTEYGFGWFVDQFQGTTRLRHHGETRGFTNAIQRFPERGLTVVVLTNRTGGEPWDLAERIAARYLAR